MQSNNTIFFSFTPPFLSLCAAKHSWKVFYSNRVGRQKRSQVGRDELAPWPLTIKRSWVMMCEEPASANYNSHEDVCLCFQAFHCAVLNFVELLFIRAYRPVIDKGCVCRYSGQCMWCMWCMSKYNSQNAALPLIP